MRKLQGLNPQSVFEYFEDLTRIPRESGNEKEVSDYLVAFAKKHNLEVIQEPCLNVIIKKPASVGYEQAPGVILQGHMDMVCVKEDDLAFDFATQPIPIVIDGDYIKTEGTTLGADNGIALAMAMAILVDQEALHPALTVIITVEEETGLAGVMKLNPENVSGEILINLDSEEEGYALVSCAGGVRHQVELPIVKTTMSTETETLDIVIAGLKGGHSGVEIDKNRANAIKLLGRLLHVITRIEGVYVASVCGGEKMNAIPKRAQATVVVKKEQVSTVQEAIQSFEEVLQNEFNVSDANLAVSVTKTQTVTDVFDEKTTKALTAIIQLTPYGPQTFSAGVKGLVESSNNIGVLTTTDSVIHFDNATRSSVASLKTEINERIKTIATLNGATSTLLADYPEWQYAPESKIRDVMLDVYRQLTGQELQISAIHAGLECGFLTERLGALDMISIGPEMHHVHTPKEALSISSTGRVYEFLCEVLKAIK